MNWFEKFFQINPTIFLSLDDYVAKCKQSLSNDIEYFRNKQQDLQTFTLDASFLQKLLVEIGYPNIQNILENLDNPELFNHYQELYNWSRSQKFSPEKYDIFFKITKMLRNHMDKLDNHMVDENKLEEHTNISTPSTNVRTVNSKCATFIVHSGNIHSNRRRLWGVS